MFKYQSSWWTQHMHSCRVTARSDCRVTCTHTCRPAQEGDDVLCGADENNVNTSNCVSRKLVASQRTTPSCNDQAIQQNWICSVVCRKVSRHDAAAHTLACCDSVAGVPSSYSTPSSASILGMAMAPPGK